MPERPGFDRLPSCSNNLGMSPPTPHPPSAPPLPPPPCFFSHKAAAEPSPPQDRVPESSAIILCVYFSFFLALGRSLLTGHSQSNGSFSPRSQEASAFVFHRRGWCLKAGEWGGGGSEGWKLAWRMSGGAFCKAKRRRAEGPREEEGKKNQEKQTGAGWRGERVPLFFLLNCLVKSDIY